MRIIKQRLLEMMLDVRIFLDVDDLKEIGDLEGYVNRSSAVLVFISDGYAESKNCMRELRSAVRLGKRLIPVLECEPKHGGLTQQAMREQLEAADAKYSTWGFDDEWPKGADLADALVTMGLIEWNRIGAFQVCA